MGKDELRAKIEACIDECEHSGSSPTEHMLLMAHSILFLADTICEAAEAVVTAIETSGPPGPGH